MTTSANSKRPKIQHVVPVWGAGGKGHSLQPHVARSPSPRLPREFVASAQKRTSAFRVPIESDVTWVG